MKKIRKFISSRLRSILNISALLFLSVLVIFFPVIKSSSFSNSPKVKAAFVSEPALPVSKNIPAPELTATGIFITDLNSGVVLLDKNANQRLKPASLTKIMTAIVAMDYYSPDTILTVINAQDSNGNTVDLKKGDELKSSDLLYALLVPSGNDAAVTFAENYPGGYQAFIAKMNSKVTQMNLLNSHFSNVSGVEGADHYTSAYDISTLAKEALSRPQFATVVSTKNITLTSLKGNQYSLETTNLMLGKSGILGVKTGWTPEAGECLVVLFEKDGHLILVSLLNSKDRFGEAQTLIDWVYTNFSWE